MRRQHLLIQSGLLIVSLVLAGTMTMAWAYAVACIECHLAQPGDQDADEFPTMPRSRTSGTHGYHDDGPGLLLVTGLL
jgi:hypothetical protein